MQVPRLTGILRGHGYPTASSTVPIDRLYIRHQSALQNAVQISRTVPEHILGSRAKDAPYAARAANSNWLNAVREAAEADIGGDELQSLATEIFWLLQNESVDRSAVSALLGAGLSAQHLTKLEEVGNGLAKERQKLQLPAERPAVQTSNWEPRFFEPAQVAWPASWDAAMQGLCRYNTALGRPAPDTATTAQPSQHSIADAAAQWDAYKEAARIIPTADPADVAPHVMDGRERTVSKMNLTALERIICRITGLSPPSKGGDQSVLLLTIGALLQHEQPDATAGLLVEVLGYSHMDQISHIVTMREVRLHTTLPVRPLLGCA